ncbi:MAG: CRISPR-associated CARF protein Csa3 [Methanomicrobiales archaeon]|nr:CRISPR-associated CARF protein Csa3 [Methanomicrobiales archaeon]MDI6876075.1 CRISPR-associated CARF protein Csa3 [Methanomicrobiales archaeon]
MATEQRKTVIVPFGFDASIVFRGYSRFSLGDGDRLVLLTPKEKNPRKDAAIQDVESFLKSLTSRGIGIACDVIEVDTSDVGGVVTKVAEIVTANRGFQYYLDASAGVRSLCVALTIAAILLKSRITGFFTFDESTSRTLEVKVPACAYRLTNTKKEILKTVQRYREMKAKDLAKAMGKDLSTISRHVTELEEANLIGRETRYDSNYRLTYYGSLILKNVVEWEGGG